MCRALVLPYYQHKHYHTLWSEILYQKLNLKNYRLLKILCNVFCLHIFLRRGFIAFMQFFKGFHYPEKMINNGFVASTRSFFLSRRSESQDTSHLTWGSLKRIQDKSHIHQQGSIRYHSLVGAVFTAVHSLSRIPEKEQDSHGEILTVITCHASAHILKYSYLFLFL